MEAVESEQVAAGSVVIEGGSPTVVVQPVSDEPVAVDRRGLLIGGGFLGAGVLLSAVAGGVSRMFGGVDVEPVSVAASDANARRSVGFDVVAEKVANSVWRVDSGTQSGSSFLISHNVLITNSHVVSGAVGDTVSVGRSGRQPIAGKILMVDSGLDLALISIPDQENVTPLQFVSVAQQRVGQDIVVAGYPIGLNLSFNAGTVSALDQVTTMRESFAQSSLLQVDAAVNPGDSGGPVLDSSGNVMGVTTFRPDTSGSRAVQGIAFALPADDVLIALQQFKDHGNVRYGYLGVSFSGIAPEGGGARVDNVVGGSPAGVAGLQPGDVITGIGGVETPGYPEISRELHKRRPGDRVSIAYSRNGVARSVEATLSSNEGDAVSSVG